MKDTQPDSPEALRGRLTDIQYRVTQQGATEAPGTGEYDQHWSEGTYACVVCDADLFASAAKFDAGCGWPSFDREAGGPGTSVERRKDISHGMLRTETRCAKCGAHLGHVFPDGPTETGERYCINSAALAFKSGSKPARESNG